MAITIKTIISIALTVVMGVAGFFGATYEITGITPAELITGNTERPRDNTGYIPVNFTWDDAGNGDWEDSRFLAGKYVRNDGNAVLYIDYEHGDGSLYFIFELFVLETSTHAGVQTAGRAFITSEGLAFYTNSANEYLNFENVGEGVVALEADLYDTLIPADGVYYIVRAKYTETPSPDVTNDTSRRGGRAGRAGRAPTADDDVDIKDPEAPPMPPSSGEIIISDPEEEEIPGANTEETPDMGTPPSDPVGEVPPFIPGDGPEVESKEIIPKTPKAHDEFMRHNGMNPASMNSEGIGAYLQGRSILMDGAMTVTYSYIYDRATWLDYYRSHHSNDEEGNRALLAFNESGGFTGDIHITWADFIFEADPRIKYEMNRPPGHVVEVAGGQIKFTGSRYEFGFPRHETVPGIVWEGGEGYLSGTMSHYDEEYGVHDMSFSLKFGFDAEGNVIANGVGLTINPSSSRKLFEINLIEVPQEDDFSRYEGVWKKNRGSDPYTVIYEIRDGHVVRNENDIPLFVGSHLGTGKMVYLRRKHDGERVLGFIDDEFGSFSSLPFREFISDDEIHDIPDNWIRIAP